MSLFQSLAHLFHPRRSNNHRPQILHPEGLLALCLVGLGFWFGISQLHAVPGPMSHVLGFASSITPGDVIDQTNEQRATLGLPPLELNRELTNAALAKGQHMFDHQYWAHIAPDGTDPWYFIRGANYTYQVAGENLARDFYDTDDMVKAWMASPTHRANIMNPKYRDIGIAVIDGQLQGYDTTLVVQMFGTPRYVDPSLPEDSGAPVAVVAAPELNPAEAGSVLASALISPGSFRAPPLFTPLQLTKAFFLAMIMVIMATLLYDAFVIGNTSTVRLVGKNLAHILLFGMVAFLVVLFKGGIVQ